jgi:hypothetical protein
VHVTEHAEFTCIESDAMPVVKVPSLSPDVSDAQGVSYSVGMKDLAEFNSDAMLAVERIIQDYENWILDQEQKIENLDTAFQNIAVGHIAECRVFLSNIKSGWSLLGSDPDVQQCLRDASAAMNQQRVAYGADTREVLYDSETKKFSVQGLSPHSIEKDQARWRPFQIAFILANLVRASAKEEIEDAAVDVIWMPDCEKTVQVAYLYVIRCTILMCVCKGCIRVAVHSPMRWSEERGTPQMCSAA